MDVMDFGDRTNVRSRANGAPSHEPAKPDFQIKWAGDLAEPVGPVSWLCEGYRISHGSYCTVAGESFSGKSLWAADLALALASDGRAAHLFDTSRGGRSLWLDYDGQGDRISRDRLQRMALARKVDLSSLQQRLGYVWLPRVHLDDDGAEESFVRLLDGISLCVIDSWRGAASSTDESNRGEVQRVGDTILRIIDRTKCTILMVDHTTKPPREGKSRRSAMHDMHGSTAKVELPQWLMIFDKQEGKPVKVRHVKERIEGKVLAPFGLQFEDVAVEQSARKGLRLVHIGAEQDALEQERLAAAEWNKTLSAVLAALAAHPDVPGADALAVRMGKRAVTIRAAVKSLEAEGKIVNSGTSKHPRWRVA